MSGEKQPHDSESIDAAMVATIAEQLEEVLEHLTREEVIGNITQRPGTMGVVAITFNRLTGEISRAVVLPLSGHQGNVVDTRNFDPELEVAHVMFSVVSGPIRGNQDEPALRRVMVKLKTVDFNVPAGHDEVVNEVSDVAVKNIEEAVRQSKPIILSFER